MTNDTTDQDSTDSPYDIDQYEQRYRRIWKVGGPAVFLGAVFLMLSVEPWLIAAGVYLLIVSITMTTWAYRQSLFEEYPLLNTVKNAVFLSVAVFLTIGIVAFSLYSVLT